MLKMLLITHIRNMKMKKKVDFLAPASIRLTMVRGLPERKSRKIKDWKNEMCMLLRHRWAFRQSNVIKRNFVLSSRPSMKIRDKFEKIVFQWDVKMYKGCVQLMG